MTPGQHTHSFPRFTMRGIRKAFGATIALDGVDLSVDAGEVHALVGENGAGKSTLMKILSGAIRSDAGTMEIDGRPYMPANAQEARHAGVAMIYQELSLAGHLTVENNIMLGMEPTSSGFVRRKEARRRTVEALEQLGHGEISPDSIVNSLPIANRQVVEIARALAVGCRVLVLDEPTSSLSLGDIERLFDIVGLLKDQGHAIVYISHFIEEVQRVADRFTVLRDGKTVGGGSTAESDVHDIIALMIGRNVDELYPRSSRTIGEPLLNVAALAGSPKPDEATFTVHRGEILGIAGLVGAGRTELLRTIFGLAPVRSGEIRIGLHSGPASPVQRWEQGAGLLSEDRAGEGLALSLPITQNIMMNLRRDTGRFGFVAPSRLAAESLELIKHLDIRCAGPRQRVGSLSGGNQQKIALARLLHEDVDILLLDEPTRGIDVGSKFQIYRLMDQLATGDEPAGRKAKGIVMVSSYFPELLGICDRIAVMCRGKLGIPAPVSEWNPQRLLLAATGQGGTS